jgi:hypothetical protein
VSGSVWRRAPRGAGRKAFPGPTMTSLGSQGFSQVGRSLALRQGWAIALAACQSCIVASMVSRRTRWMFSDLRPCPIDEAPAHDLGLPISGRCWPACQAGAAERCRFTSRGRSGGTVFVPRRRARPVGAPARHYPRSLRMSLPYRSGVGALPEILGLESV